MNAISDEVQTVMMDSFCQAASMCFSAIAEDAGSPHVLMRPHLFMDGSQWCASYGDMPEGVHGFGDSPDKAMRDFDRQWFAAAPQPGAEDKT